MAKSEPLSIEALLEKQRAEKEAALKVCDCLTYSQKCCFNYFTCSQSSCLKKSGPRSQFRNVHRRSRSRKKKRSAKGEREQSSSARRKLFARKKGLEKKETGMVEAVDVSERISHPLSMDNLVTMLL